MSLLRVSWCIKTVTPTVALNAVRRISQSLLGDWAAFPLPRHYLSDLHIDLYKCFFSQLSPHSVPTFRSHQFSILIKICLFIFFPAFLISFFSIDSYQKLLSYPLDKLSLPKAHLFFFLTGLKGHQLCKWVLSSWSESLERMTL